MLDGLLAPVLWTDRLMSSVNFTGWETRDTDTRGRSGGVRDVEMSERDTLGVSFKLGLSLEKYDLVRDAFLTNSTNLPQVSFGDIRSYLSTVKNTFDHKKVRDQVEKVTESLQTATDEISDISNMLANWVNSMATVGDTVKTTPIVKIAKIILSLAHSTFYIILIPGAFYFYKYLNRSTKDQKPTTGLRIFTLILATLSITCTYPPVWVYVCMSACLYLSLSLPL